MTVGAETELNGSSSGHQAQAPAQVLCPYCGSISSEPTRCTSCKGLFEPLSRQATQNAMGPWQVKDPKNPFLPGCAYEKIKEAVAKGKIRRETIMRGPTTRQFWSFACNTPGVAVLLGECHACHTRVDTDEYMCAKCGAVLNGPQDRQSLGLAAIAPLPGQAPPSVIAKASIGATTQRPSVPPALRKEETQAAVSNGAQLVSEAGLLGSVRAEIAAANLASAEMAARGGVSAATARRLRQQNSMLRAVIIVLSVVVVGALGLTTFLLAQGTIGVSGGAASTQSNSAASQTEKQPASRDQGASRVAPATTNDVDETASKSAEPQVVQIPDPFTQPKDGSRSSESGGQTKQGNSSSLNEFLTAAKLDSELEPWRREFDEAIELARAGDRASVEASIEKLNMIVESALASDPAKASNTVDVPYPLIEQVIVRLEDRLDELKLKEML